jgi:hypothetical protein
MTTAYQPTGIPDLWTCTLCWSTVLGRDAVRHEAFHDEQKAWMNSVRENFDAINASFEGVEKALKKLGESSNEVFQNHTEALKNLGRRIVEGR